MVIFLSVPGSPSASLKNTTLYHPFDAKGPTLETSAGAVTSAPLPAARDDRSHDGKVIGATDDLGFRAVEDHVHVHDLHATMLSLLGLDHQRLAYLFEGRLRRLTDVGGHNNLAERLTRA
jgi:hypothetical protein